MSDRNWLGGELDGMPLNRKWRTSYFVAQALGLPSRSIALQDNEVLRFEAYPKLFLDMAVHVQDLTRRRRFRIGIIHFEEDDSTFEELIDTADLDEANEVYDEIIAKYLPTDERFDERFDD
jgi:hypothetical protein